MTSGTGKITINKTQPEKYFPNSIVINDMLQPLQLLDVAKKYDINVKVTGGGFSGQAGAIRLAIANVLVKVNPDDKNTLKAKKLTTQDKRVKERKKYGKYGARRSPQFTKR
jgi:small subunit ribosomal protein S9